MTRRETMSGDCPQLPPVECSQDLRSKQRFRGRQFLKTAENSLPRSGLGATTNYRFFLEGVWGNLLFSQKEGSPTSSAARFPLREKWWVSPVVIWLMATIIAVLARGLHWDESYEHAQILAGMVQYPEGHPQAVYAHNAFTVQTAVSALLLRCGAGAWGVEFFRNVLFLLATVLPPCLLTIVATGRAWLGHMAALLTLCGVFLAFDGSYPLMVWPETYSNGHIGGGWALVALALLLGGNPRAGALLFGLLPAVHVGQWPVLLGWMGCAGAWLAFNGQWHTLRRGAVWAALGLALTTVFAVFHYAVLRVPIDAELTGEARELWAAFTGYHDLHRQPPGVNGQCMIIATLVLSGLALTGRPLRWPHAGIALYAAGIAAAVWMTQVLTALLGDGLPFVFQAWMPYRMINHLPACFVALAFALLTRRERFPWPELLLVGYTAVLALLPTALRFAGDGTVGTMLRAYLGEGDAVVFVLFGAAVAVGVESRWRWALVAVCVAPLAWFHQFGAACVVAGAAVAGLSKMGTVPSESPSAWTVPFLRLSRRALSRMRGPHPYIQALLFLAVLLVLVGHQARYRVSLPMPAFQARVAALLQEEPDALVVTEPFPFLWQAQTGVAIFTDATSHSLVSYLPALAPRIEAMYTEVYGITLRAAALADYRDTWAHRDARTWRTLAARWHFTHVAAPSDVPLNLPVRIEEGGWRLHDVKPMDAMDEMDEMDP